ncbi:CocE/NonD family hydrolase [Lichenibacterium dinghuense]|uniref:CocE/NonD family hydrolase n=1 Tax=Lichenibacterium dinghuense TaxID=2895977 RepID=UPI001F01C1B5|nr:CocE/NonD family hydrolase [Lichenibacterium sp. 6Y81]
MDERYEVEITENLWIPLADGTRLAARMWRPRAAGPVPAVLEYIPYRKRDGTRGRDDPMHGFFAAAGYAALRVDMRGSGDSDGLLDDEYLAQEQDDALEVIAWIADQPWCSGAVGMMGKSWGGFNALQVAARRPPALAAIVTVCSTDDRFGDDIHYKGGCLLNDNLWWGSIMLAYQGRPPDPEIRADWRERWIERLDAMPFWPALWLAHQTRDGYWRHGSVCEDWGAIRCPVLAVGGWTDAYTDAVPRLLANLDVPRLGIVGPWAHVYPQDGSPGPAIDFLGECTRWWDHWLKGRDTGAMAEPRLRAFVEDWQEPSATRRLSEGRFVGVETEAEQLRFGLAPGRLTAGAGEPARLAVKSPPWTGTGGGEWMGTGVAGERPTDQRLDDGLSLCFDTEPLPEPVEILGNPSVEFVLASDRPQAQLAVRLCDVAPDGSSLRVSYAVLNLAHRDGSADPRPMVPGAPVRVSIALKMCGHRVPAGHRLRLAVSTACWPLVWPARDDATLTIETGDSRLTLPTAAGARDARFEPPRHGPAAPATVLAGGRAARRVTFDVQDGTAAYVIEAEGGLFGEGTLRFDDIGTELSHDLTRTLTVGRDPLSAETRIVQRYAMGREGWRVRIETEAAMRGDAECFTIEGELRAYEGDALVRTRTWRERIPRRDL